MHGGNGAASVAQRRVGGMALISSVSAWHGGGEIISMASQHKRRRGAARIIGVAVAS